MLLPTRTSWSVDSSAKPIRTVDPAPRSRVVSAPKQFCSGRFAAERAQLADALGELSLLRLVERACASGVVGADGQMSAAAALARKQRCDAVERSREVERDVRLGRVVDGVHTNTCSSLPPPDAGRCGLHPVGI